MFLSFIKCFEVRKWNVLRQKETLLCDFRSTGAQYRYQTRREKEKNWRVKRENDV